MVEDAFRTRLPYDLHGRESLYFRHVPTEAARGGVSACRSVHDIASVPVQQVRPAPLHRGRSGYPKRLDSV